VKEKDKKVNDKCSVCGKPIKVYAFLNEKLCKKHREEKHKDDFAILADYIMGTKRQ
jgi:hypothetical protein